VSKTHVPLEIIIHPAVQVSVYKRKTIELI